MKKNIDVVKKILKRFKESIITLSKHEKEKAMTKAIEKFTKEILNSIVKTEVVSKKKKTSYWDKDRIIDYFENIKKENKK